MESILALIEEDVHLRRVTAHELSGPCPECGGDDRFRVWPEQGRWWCRRCEKGGDAIQYLREFHGMGYREACAELGIEPQAPRQNRQKPQWTPKPADTPCLFWQEKAREVLARAEEALWSSSGERARTWLSKRGLSEETVREAPLGYLKEDERPARERWGLVRELNDDGKPKRLWLPGGILIPLIRGVQLMRLRVRRPKPDPPYVMISGSSSCPMALGNCGLAAVVVESELDGLLLHQEAGDLVTVVALGSASIRPDQEAFEILAQVETILVALDSDDGGVKEAWTWWREHFSQARRWPVPIGKDPGEAWQGGADLRAWVLAGLVGDAQEAFEERAAIMEYEGNLEQREAEWMALKIMGGEAN